ncbi:MAG: S41 family peptidase [Chitinophagales bacterium]
MKKHTITLLFLLLISGLFAQSTDYKIDSQEQKRTIDSISSNLKANYVFPDMAEKMNKLIIKKFKKKEYKSITDPFQFAEQLTQDLQSVSNDLHLRVMYAPDRIAEQNNAVSEADNEVLEKRRIEQMKRSNFGFQEVKILQGNTGYLDLRGFYDPQYAGETAVAAMNFLSNTDALIIDLRLNGGGEPAMIQLITSYLYESEPVHLNNFYWRPSDEYTQSWTLPHVQGERMPTIPVYILTSKRTFSAAEEFSYNLKNLKRATLIGETTGGGAHPGDFINVTDKFMVWIPQGRAINPNTNTNWEGTGVEPHIKVSPDDALLTAQLEALNNLINTTEDNERKSYFSWHLEGIKTKMNPVNSEELNLEQYEGTYGTRTIMLENGKLFYQIEGRNKFKLIPMGNHWFMLDGLGYFRIEFEIDGENTIALIGHYDSGRLDKSPKTQ